MLNGKTPPHPATLAQRKAPPGGVVAERPPHPATLAQRRGTSPWAVQRMQQNPLQGPAAIILQWAQNGIATINAADHLQLGDVTGRIAAGYAADIIAVDGDPTRDVTVLMNVPFVMARGTVFKND